MDTLSVSLPIDSAINIDSDLTDSQQTVNIFNQILQSPNIDPSWSMDLSNDVIINEMVGGYRRDGDQDSARLSRLNLTTFFMPSIKIRFSFTDNQ